MSNHIILVSQDTGFSQAVEPSLKRDFDYTLCTDYEALEGLVARLQPQVILFRLGRDPLEVDHAVTAILVHEDTPVFVLDQSPSIEIGKVMVKAGARGYADSNIAPELIVKGIYGIETGELFVARDVMRSMMDELMSAGNIDHTLNQSDKLQALTPRERQVAKLVAKGCSNKDVAEELSLTVRTVKAHLTAAFDKTGTRSRLELSLLLRGELGLPQMIVDAG